MTSRISNLIAQFHHALIEVNLRLNQIEAKHNAGEIDEQKAIAVAAWAEWVETNLLKTMESHIKLFTDVKGKTPEEKQEWSYASIEFTRITKAIADWRYKAYSLNVLSPKITVELDAVNSLLLKTLDGKKAEAPAGKAKGSKSKVADKLSRTEMGFFLSAFGKTIIAFDLTVNQAAHEDTIGAKAFLKFQQELRVFGVLDEDMMRIYELGCIEAFKINPTGW